MTHYLVAPGQLKKGIKYSVLYDNNLSRRVSAFLTRACPESEFLGFADQPEDANGDPLVVCSPDWLRLAEDLGWPDNLHLLPVPVSDPWAWENFSPNHPRRVDHADFEVRLSKIVRQFSGQHQTLMENWVLPLLKARAGEFAGVLAHLADEKSRIELKTSLLGTPSDWYRLYSDRIFSGLQYFDIINYEKIRTVFNVGVHSGFEIPFFFLNRKPDLNLINFDPLGEDYLTDYVSAFLNEIQPPVVFERLCLSDRSGEQEFILSSEQVLSLDGKEEAAKHLRKERFPVTTIDAYCAERPELTIDLIKMDIEGSEPRALRGGLETIRRDRPQLAISIYHAVEHHIDIPQFLMSELEGYRFFVRRYAPVNCEVILYAIPEEVMPVPDPV